MAIPRLHRLVRVFIRALGFAAVTAWGGAGCTSYPSPPADPVYETEVRPIFLAHCTRCHGDGPDGGSRNTVPGSSKTGAVPVSCLTQYGPNPNAPDGGCQSGANEEASNRKLDTYVHGQVAGEQMPPPPAALLNSYELGVIDNWVGEGDSRKCSDSPNPDPALICTTGSYP